MKTLVAALFVLLPTVANADLVHEWKSPAFNGQGYSNHVLGIEQLQFNRQKDIDDAARAEEERLERELEQSTLNKFIRNVESRIYATLSKQMVDNMFASCGGEDEPTCATSGTTEIEGATIAWTKDETTGSITLVVDSDDGYTEITIPGPGEFTF
jgi:hypothetical protein